MVMLSDEQLREVLTFTFDALRQTRHVWRELGISRELQHHLRQITPSRRALQLVRATLEDRDDIRVAMGHAVAQLPESERQSLDEVVSLWLVRPEGWQERLSAVLAERAEQRRGERAAAEERDAARRLRSVEEILERSRTELAALRTEAALLREQRDSLERSLNEADQRAQGVQHRAEESAAETRRAKQTAERASAEVSDMRLRLGAADDEIDVLRNRVGELEQRLDEALRARVESDAAWAAEREARIDGEVDRARRSPAVTVPVPVREPVAIPGGRLDRDIETVDYLVRFPDMVVLVDGYNVSKTAWPDLTLEQERDRLVAALENLVTRTSARVRVVFDGASGAVGGSARRMLVDVQFSSEGVIADDVIVQAVRALPADRKVLVVTADGALTSRVRALGANTVVSTAFVDYLLG